MSAVQLKKMNWRHQALLDWLVTNPHRKLTECAEELGYSLSWVSTVVHSDLFQGELRRRRASLEAVQDHEITGKLGRFVTSSIDSLQRKVDAGVLDSKTMATTTRDALRALGYGVSKGSQVNIQNNVQASGGGSGDVPAETVLEARRIYEQMNGGRPAGAISPQPSAPRSKEYDDESNGAALALPAPSPF